MEVNPGFYTGMSWAEKDEGMQDIKIPDTEIRVAVESAWIYITNWPPPNELCLTFREARLLIEALQKIVCQDDPKTEER